MADVIHMMNKRIPGDSSPRPVLLIVDDDSAWRRLSGDICRQALADQGAIVLECDSVPAALAILADRPVHAVILDKNLGADSANPLHNGIQSIPRLLAVQDHLQIVTATSSEEVEDVEEAIQNGACTYIVKHKNMKYGSIRISPAVFGVRA